MRILDDVHDLILADTDVGGFGSRYGDNPVGDAAQVWPVSLEPATQQTQSPVVIPTTQRTNPKEISASDLQTVLSVSPLPLTNTTATPGVLDNLVAQAKAHPLAAALIVGGVLYLFTKD